MVAKQLVLHVGWENGKVTIVPIGIEIIGTADRQTFGISLMLMSLLETKFSGDIHPTLRMFQLIL